MPNKHLIMGGDSSSAFIFQLRIQISQRLIQSRRHAFITAWPSKVIRLSWV